MLKRAVCFLLMLSLLLSVNTQAKDINSLISPSAILMDGTGKVLFEKNPDEKLPPASVTKIMTMLLVMEAIDRGEIAFDDIVTVSENAAKKEMIDRRHRQNLFKLQLMPSFCPEIEVKA